MIRVEIIGVEAAAAAAAAFDGGQEDKVVADDDDDILLISNLIEWLKSNGAYINDDVEVRQIIPIPTTTPTTTTNTNNKLSGIFAKVDIPKGKIICTIPYDLIIKPNIYSKLQQGTYCSTVSKVYDSISKLPELQNPYEKYLATRTRNHLPQFWTLDGQRILDELIGLSIRGEEFIFKKKKKKRFNNKNKKKKKKKRNNKDDWVGHYFKQCLNINLDDYEEKKDSEDYYYDEEMILLEYLNDDYLMNSIMIVYTRGEGPNLEHIIPFHDINNHGNGNKNWNVDISDPRRLLLSSLKNNKNNMQYSIYAKRDIKAGEQLMHSYNQCKWCNTQYTNPFDENSFFVTAQILLWYGFVEDYPQRYIIPSARLFFDIDYINTTNNNNKNDHNNINDNNNIDIAAFADDDDNEKLMIESLDVNFVVPPTNRSISYLIKTIGKLDEFKQQYLIVSDTTTTTIPEIEINTIRQFHQSIVIAFKAALRQGQQQQQQQQQPSLDDDKVWSLGNNEWYWEEYDQKGKWYWEDREINIDAGDDGGIDDRFEL